MNTIINEEAREAVESEMAALETAAAAAPAGPETEAERLVRDAPAAPAPDAIEVTPEEKLMQEFAGAAPLSIAVKISDTDKTFTITVKRGKDSPSSGTKAEVLETFEGLTVDDFGKRIDDPATGSKLIVLNEALANAIILDVSKQRLLKAMAVRHAQIGAEFKERVVDPIKRYDAAMDERKRVAASGTADEAAALTAPEALASLEALRIAAESAQDKLRVFGSVRDKNLGMRLAIMTRKERTKYWAEVRHSGGERARKHLANAKRKAKKARRR